MQSIPIVGKPEYTAQVQQGISNIIIDFEPLAKKYKETSAARIVTENKTLEEVIGILNTLQHGL